MLFLCIRVLSFCQLAFPKKEYNVTMKRSFIAAFAILACLMFAWATGAGRPYPANAGGVIDPSCTSSLPCIEYDNNGTGPGIRGISVTGNGLAGSTKNASTSVSNGRAGLIGNDIGAGTFNSGVHGISVSGTGVSGLSTNGAGVTGQSTNAPGLISTSINFDGIRAFTSHKSLTSGFGSSGAFGQDISTDGGRLDAGVAGFSSNGIGVVGLSSFVGVNAVGGSSIGGDEFPALSIVANHIGGLSFDDLIDACDSGTSPCDSNNFRFRVDGDGSVCSTLNIQANNDILSLGNFDISGAGEYIKNTTCVAGCTVATATSAGRAVVTYAPTSQPSIEDFGEAQLSMVKPPCA
jgi:hypothetical protein